MLFCTVCKHMMEEGAVQCPYCRNGYGSALACVVCKQNVVVGSDSCSTCAPRQGQNLRRRFDSNERDAEDRAITTYAPPGGGVGGGMLTASIPMPTLVPEVYSHGRHGAISEVQMNGRDAEILNKMGAAASLLHALALEMNGLVGHMPSTRMLIKNCRGLASDLQEEIEVRIGPRG